MRVTRDPDRGSITVLVIGYTGIAMALIVAGVDVSKVFLAQRALSSAADAAAIAAAEGVDTGQVYDGPALRCGASLPLDRRSAERMADRAIADESPDLRHAFASLRSPQTTVSGSTATVALQGRVAVPFGRLLTWLRVAGPDGTVPVAATAHARSPVSGNPAACAPGP